MIVEVMFDSVENKRFYILYFYMWLKFILFMIFYENINNSIDV